MTDYPKKFAKGDKVKVAGNRRQEVELKFAGFKQVNFDITPTNEEPPADHVARVEALTGASIADREKTPPEIGLLDMFTHDEARGAEVVDATDDKN